MKKRLPVLLLALVMIFSFAFAAFACKPEEDKPSGGSKKKLVVWSMSNEVVDLLKYYELANPDKYEFEIVFTNNDDGSYETKLDNAFKNQSSEVDLFLTDVDYTKKYVDSDYSEDLVSFYEKTLNAKGYDKVKEALEKDMYGYTLDIGTREVDEDKKQLKAVSFQVTPGAMFYRADLFLELVENGLYGEDKDFAAFKEENKLSEECKLDNYADWKEEDKQKLDAAMDDFVGTSMDEFLEASETVAENAYNKGLDHDKKILMINNLEDVKRVFYADRASFVQDDKVVLDDKIMDMLDFAKDIYPYTHKGAQWDNSWNAGMKAANDKNASYKTLSFFLPTWGLFYVLENEETAGLWRMIDGPQAYYWGGTYCMINTYSKNKADAFEVLNFLTTLPFMQARSAFSGDVMNSKSLNEALANMNALSNPFLGGQNHFATFNALAADIDATNVTKYDSTVDRIFSDVMKRYAAGKDDDVKTIDDVKNTLEEQLKSDLGVKEVKFGSGS